MKSTPRPSLIPGSLVVLLAVSALALSGCATGPANVAATEDPAMTSVDKALQRSKSDLPEFTASSTAKPAPAKESGPAISLDYAGEAKVLLARLAKANGMEYRTLGPQPHLPLFVVVNAKDARLADVLRDAGEQFGERADLVLKDKAIEVVYRAR
jgi:defect-in-organelle-trafficking protein DotD